MWSKPRIYAHRAEQFRVTQRDISEEQSWITGPPSDPPKNGCRTFPSADLARYSISARNLGSTKCLCEQCAWRKVASSGRAARASPADPRPRLYRSHGPRCRRRRGGRPSAGRRRARPICSHRARSQRWSGSPAARRSSSPSRSSAPSDIGCRGPSNDALQPEPAGVRVWLDSQAIPGSPPVGLMPSFRMFLAAFTSASKIDPQLVQTKRDRLMRLAASTVPQVRLLLD
jgi:hypothetical protein